MMARAQGLPAEWKPALGSDRYISQNILSLSFAAAG